jgi:hypothetical protein
MNKAVPALVDVVDGVADLFKEEPLSPSEKRWINTLFQPLLDDLPMLPRDQREQPARYGIAVRHAMLFLAKYRDVERLKAEGADTFLATMELGGMHMIAKIALGLLPAIQAGKKVASGGARGARELHGDTDANYASYCESFDHYAESMSDGEADEAAARHHGVSARTIRQAKARRTV